MEALQAAPAGSKPRNAHAPTCECVVCVNRRRADERRQQRAASAGGSEGDGDAGAEGGADAEEGEEQQQETAGQTDKQHVKAEVSGRDHEEVGGRVSVADRAIEGVDGCSVLNRDRVAMAREMGMRAQRVGWKLKRVRSNNRRQRGRQTSNM